MKTSDTWEYKEILAVTHKRKQKEARWCRKRGQRSEGFRFETNSEIDCFNRLPTLKSFSAAVGSVLKNQLQLHNYKIMRRLCKSAAAIPSSPSPGLCGLLKISRDYVQQRARIMTEVVKSDVNPIQISKNGGKKEVLKHFRFHKHPQHRSN